MPVGAGMEVGDILFTSVSIYGCENLAGPSAGAELDARVADWLARNFTHPAISRSGVNPNVFVVEEPRGKTIGDSVGTIADGG
jgi:hypothetical protein